MKTGIEIITEERKRHFSEEGWDDEHDDSHDNHELAMAAATYALPAGDIEIDLDQKNGGIRGYIRILRSVLFPWEYEWWKPTPHDRIKELGKSGALIAAEIDRLQRLKKSDKS